MNYEKLEDLFFEMTDWIELHGDYSIANLHWWKDGSGMFLDTVDETSIPLPDKYSPLVTSGYLS